MALHLSSMKLESLKLFYSSIASKLKKSVHQEASIHIFLDCVLCAKPENNNPAEVCRLWKINFSP